MLFAHNLSLNIYHSSLKINRLKGKIAVFTGIGAGIEQGNALVFAREGASVFGSDINESLAKATSEIVKQEGLEFQYLQGDLTNETDVKNLMEKAVASYDKIDILVNAAAFCDFKSIEELDYETS